MATACTHTRRSGYRPHPMMALAGLIAILVCLAAGNADGARIKDIVRIRGVRANQLVGYGLVVGLNGTGDKDAKFTLQSVSSLLERMGLSVNAADIKADNVASVMVTAELPAFARTGSRIDVLVNAIGGAKNLQGGTLLMTPLRGADGRVYSVAQGPVSTGGFSAGGNSGGRVQKNFPTVGRVVGGGLIEAEIPNAFQSSDQLTLSLRRPDFTTASRVAQAIQTALPETQAVSPDAGTVLVNVPPAFQDDVVGLVTRIESLGVTPDTSARVVINERTGTVVMGAEVRLSTIAIAHGNLSIQIRETQNVSQPLPLSDGQTAVTPESDIAINEDRSPIFLVPSGVSIGDLVRGLNALGVTPRDLIAIFQAIKSAGALQAELEVI